MTDTRKWSRRGFVQSALAGGAALLGGNQLLAAARAAASRGKIPIGVQLYSLRALCDKDLPGTLAGLSKIGYQGVEFAGYHKRTATDLRKLLGDHGLKAAGTHLDIETLIGDELKRTVEFNQTIGNRNLIVPWLDEKKYRSSKAAWLETSKLFTELAANARAIDPEMRVGYHNHNVEFRPMDGEVPWLLFYKNTTSNVIMQLDTGNAHDGGGDPLALIKQTPGRVVSTHIKEFSDTKKGPIIGEGDMKWEEYFRVAETTAGTEWYIVEEESDMYPGLESPKRSLNALRRMGK